MGRLVRGKGFTLIELLVVIAIIAILASILFPVFTRARENGKMVKCAHNLREIGLAMRFYGNDWNGRFPTAYEWSSGHPLLFEALNPYVKNNQIFRCPSDSGEMITVTGTRIPYWKSYGTSYGWPGQNYIGVRPYLSGLSQECPQIPNMDPPGTWYGWIWRLPLSKRLMVFDHVPWHFNSDTKVGDRISAKGFNNVVYCDGHTKPMDYQKFLHYLGIIRSSP